MATKKKVSKNKKDPPYPILVGYLGYPMIKYMENIQNMPTVAPLFDPVTGKKITSYEEEMETREGNKYWIDRFFAKHLVILYYWIMVGYYFADPSNAYDINMKIEKHAFETYTKYSAYHPEDIKIAEIAQDELNHAKELQHVMLMIT